MDNINNTYPIDLISSNPILKDENLSLLDKSDIYYYYNDIRRESWTYQIEVFGYCHADKLT